MNPSSTSSSQLLRYVLVLGLLTAIGPFAIDMYLPALPAMGHALHADVQAMQLSLMAFFLAMGAGQLVAGPLSDIYGRKRPIYVGLALFIAASIGCAFAPNLEVLVALRFLQGLGACVCTVTPRAVVRDLYSGPDAARLMSMLIMVYSVSPILAPVLGSVVTALFGWRAVFGTVGLLALVCCGLVWRFLAETRPAAARSHRSLGAAMAGYGVLLRDRQFVGIAMVASFTVSGFFVYVANSPFVLSTHYGVSPHFYAVLFGLNALPLVLLSQFNGRLTARFGVQRVLRVALSAHVVAMVLLPLLLWLGVDSLGLVVGLLLVGFGLNGVIVPLSFVTAMEGHPTLAGSASALIGTLNFAGAAVVVAAVSPFTNGTPLPMALGIAACSVAGFLLSRRTLKVRRAAPPVHRPAQALR